MYMTPKKQFTYKNGIAERIDSNDIPKTIDEQVQDFMKLGAVEKIEFLEKYGNETWKLAKELAKRKNLITKCQNAMFRWKNKEE